MEASWLQTISRLYCITEKYLAYLKPVADILLKLWVANVFFKAGLTKVESFETTLMLFADEYAVPVLSPVIAAYLATIAELVLPVLLVLGLGGRLVPLALFIFNVVAAISYPDLSSAGMQDHYIWGIMLLVLIAYGSGNFSLDKVIRNKLLN